MWAGWAGEGDGIFGGELSMPLSNCWGVRGIFNYLIPDENGVASIPEEAWGIGISLVWYPGEGHGNQLRASRLDYSLRMMAWFDHFLMKGGKDLPPAEMEYEESK